MAVQNRLPNLLDSDRVDLLERIHRDFEVTIVSCVLWHERDKWVVRPRTVPDSLFLFPIRGRLWARVRKRRQEIGPGQFLMIPEGMPHALGLARGCRQLDQIALHGYVSNAWRLPLLSWFPSPFHTILNRAYWFTELKRLVCLMNTRPALGQRHGERLVKSLLSSLVLEGADCQAPEIRIDARIQKALFEIHHNYKADLSVETLADACLLSTVQFRKLFRRAVGASPKAYLARHRLKVAAERLRATNRSIKQIAYDVGFREDHYFHLSFRNVYGCTPTEYRKGLRNEV